MKGPNPIGHKSNEQIATIVDRLGQASLTPSSHLYYKYGTNKIEAVKEHSNEYSNRAQSRPALGLIEVVLSANRDYNKHVLPNISRIEKTDLTTFDDLVRLTNDLSPDDFYSFCGPKDPKKFEVLKEILKTLPILKKKYPQACDDHELMRSWAKDVDLSNYQNDVIGEINNVAIATVQHLRMTFGHDTVKPDRRVKQVLQKEFDLFQPSEFNSILAVEMIADVVGLSALVVDQIFVNYGSGYYRNNGDEGMGNEHVIWPQHEVFYIESMLTITRTAMADQTMLRTILEQMERGERENEYLFG